MKIIEKADGSVDVQGDAGTVLTTQASIPDARAWLISQIAPEGSGWTVDEAAAFADRVIAGEDNPVQQGAERCRYCGTPTRHGHCTECGTEPALMRGMLA